MNKNEDAAPGKYGDKTKYTSKQRTIGNKEICRFKHIRYTVPLRRHQMICSLTNRVAQTSSLNHSHRHKNRAHHTSWVHQTQKHTQTIHHDRKSIFNKRVQILMLVIVCVFGRATLDRIVAFSLRARARLRSRQFCDFDAKRNARYIFAVLFISAEQETVCIVEMGCTSRAFRSFGARA